MGEGGTQPSNPKYLISKHPAFSVHAWNGSAFHHNPEAKKKGAGPRPDDGIDAFHRDLMLKRI
jgi:hypothetical protein